MVDATISEVVADLAKKKNISTTFATNYLYLGGLKITCLGPIDVTNGLEPTVTKQNYNSLVLYVEKC